MPYWVCPKETAGAERLRSRRLSEAREGKRRRFADDIKMGSGLGWGATDDWRPKLSVGEPRLD